jgi:hypothetical protein
MSEEGGFGIAFAEKLFGALLMVVGVLAMYFEYTSVEVLGGFVGFLAFLNIVIIALGFLLLTAKTE